MKTFNMIVRVGCLLVYCFLSHNAKSQTLIFPSDKRYCLYNGGEPITVNNISIHSENSTEQYKLFKNILSLANIRETRIVLASADMRGPACFVKIDTVSYIIYNPSYFSNKADYVILGVLAHEIGHYINHHDNIGSRSDLEIDADYYTGFFLKRLGFSELNQAYACLDLIDSDKATATHPAKSERKISIENGWKNADNNASPYYFSGSSPRIVWKEDDGNVTIDISGKEIKQRLFYRNEMVYIPGMNMTLQLHGLAMGATKGTGRIVNNRTNLVYIRTTAGHYKLFRKGEIVALAEAGEQRWDGNDYVVTLYDPELKRRIQYVLEDYAFARNGLFMPGFAK